MWKYCLFFATHKVGFLFSVVCSFNIKTICNIVNTYFRKRIHFSIFNNCIFSNNLS